MQLDQTAALAEAIARLSATLDTLRGADTLFNSSAVSLGSRSNGVLSAQPANSMPAIAVYCLGTFQLSLRGRQVDTWRAVKPRTLFQYLISHRQRAVARDTLVDALWPDPDTAPSGSALKVVVHRVRKLLKQTTPGLEIQATDEGYRLDGQELWVDVEEFERWCYVGRRYEGDGRAEEAAASYARAASLYRGDFLEDVPDEWVILRRERLKDQYLLALARLADAAFADLDYEQCIERCQQILTHDPCREQAYRFLMLCYAHLGQRSRVQRWYDVCVQTLRSELDVEPEADTRDTYSRAMAGNHSGMSLLTELHRRVTRP
jgi:DNA-binding SARP family transcriptional activator